MDSHKQQSLTLNDIAAAIGYNAKYLSRSINQTAGLGFSTLLSMLRTEDARFLLKSTSRTIIDIAMECGFGSERSFYRQFHELTGQTPREYRESEQRRAMINHEVI